MPSESHERELELFDACLELPPAEWIGYLQAACGEDAPLRARVQRLLAAHRRAEGVTLKPLAALLDGTPTAGTDESDAEEAGTTERPSHTVGPYRLVSLLAEGGMGSVWVAERSDGMVNRPIALKLPRGTWQRATLTARMAREREILATLNHPHIARLYDAGLTSDGQPYLALEYVEGRRIDEYCRNAGLDLAARLRLFIQVANAVAYANSKLIVHRDLKPANILVTAAGEARLLDFGIAKLLEDGEALDSELTQLTGRAFTPDYASPEQVAGAPVSVASDVYSLGVVLYELLTEAPPYKVDRSSRRALEEAILDTDPSKPSDAVAERSSRRALRGDLDTIVLKALKKRPEDRYATVNAFADDVERFLQGRPVLAQPDRASYRARRFVGRNKLAVAAVAAICVAVTFGATAAVWQARNALAEKERAEEVKDFIASIFRDANPFAEQGQALSAGDLLKQAKGKIDHLSATRPELRAELLNLVGTSLLAIGDTDAAEGVAVQAIQETRQALGADHPQTIQARLLMTDVQRFRGRVKEMRQELDTLLPIVRQREQSHPEDYVRTLENLAHMAIDDSKHDEAVAAGKAAFELASRRLGPHHPRTVAAASVRAEAQLSGATTPTEADVAVAEQALRLAEGAHPENARHPTVINMRDVYGGGLAAIGEMHRGIAEIEQAQRDATAVFGPKSRTLGFMSHNLALFQRWVGDIEGSLANSNRAIAILEQHAERESYTYANQQLARGVTCLAARRGELALRDLTEAERTFEKLLGPKHWETLTARFNRAIALAYLGRTGEARKALQLAYDRSPEVKSELWALYVVGTIERLGGDYAAALRAQEEGLALIDGPRAQWNRMRALVEIGLDQVELGRHEEGLVSLERAHTLFAELQTLMHPARAEVLVGLGRARLATGQPIPALPHFEEADAFWRKFDAENRWAGEAALWLGRCYKALGRDPEAGAALSRATRILARSPIASDAKLVRLARAN